MNERCEFFMDALAERVTGGLEPDRRARLDAHLADCAECRDALRSVQALKAAPLVVPAGLEARIRSAVREVAAAPEGRPAVHVDGARVSRPRFGRWRPWALPLAAAAAAAGVWLGIGAPGMGRGEPALNGGLVFDEYDPYGAWPADGVFVAGQPVLSELSVEELERLLRELES
jgi:anti-sigma factor RsiW